MTDPVQQSDSAGMTWGSVWSFLGGGGLVALAEVVRRAYTTRVRREEHADDLKDRKSARDADDSRIFVHEANEERRATLVRVEEQAKEITRLSVEVALCREKHAAMEERDEEKNRQIQNLETALDLTRQLVKRQHDEIAAQEEVIAKQGRELVLLHAELGELRNAFDAFVQRAMGVTSTSEIPGA